jgi:ABC-type bacteriocin/lantibiotic exporter with double-glycine peptidase domain
VVRNWPEEVNKPVLDMGITYIMVDLSQRIYSDHFTALADNSLALENIRHTMVNPTVYYRERYPGIQCLQK